MAELFRAKLTGAQGFEKLIAIKKILPNLLAEENLVTSFIDEAKLAALLHHENIIQIYDFGSMADQYFIAMEFLFGKDLRTITRTARKKGLAHMRRTRLFSQPQESPGKTAKYHPQGYKSSKYTDNL